MSDKPIVLPCPFCGWKPRPAHIMQGFVQHPYIRECPFNGRAARLDLWNSRASTGLIAELEALVKSWDNWADTHLDGIELEIAVKCHRDLRVILERHKQQEGGK